MYDETKTALAWMCIQYCRRLDNISKEDIFDHEFMSAGETAFKLLGIKNGDHVDTFIEEKLRAY